MSAGDATSVGPTAAPLSVSGALETARRAGLSRLDAQLLLGNLLARSRSWLIGHDDALLQPDQAAAWAEMVRRRADGEPVAYLLRQKEFHGLMLDVDPSVLVPRPDTETLVTWALETLDRREPGSAPARVVDLGCGSGAIALALKAARRDLDMTATDDSGDALAVAMSNGNKLGLTVDWRSGDWWAALPGRRFDLALSNPPYIASGDPHLHALRHEPKHALVAGADGLSDLRKIIQGACKHLEPGAWLLLEHGFQQAADVRLLLAEAGFMEVQSRVDLAGQPRCSGGFWPGHR